jgi:uncharacterized protein YcnI
VISVAIVSLSLVGSGAAFAHVTTDPDEITRGEYNQLSFRVPNESPTASTVKVELTFPTDVPITSVRTAPVPGWTAEVVKGAINPPVTGNDVTITEAVRTVTWTAQPGNGVAPGQFGLFHILTGEIPETGERLVIPATETYSDGHIVRWDQASAADGSEPKHPAPLVRVSGTAEHAHGPAKAQGGTDDTARWMAGVGLLLGAVGLGAGGGAILANRRSGIRPQR